MVRFATITAISLLPSLVSAMCKDPSTGASITVGAWNANGVNGTWIPARLDDNRINTQNPSWTIPDETWSYAQGEMGDRGPNYMSQYTCSKLTFCNPENAPDDTADSAGGRRHLIDAFSAQDVWKLASKAQFDACDFTDAELIGTTGPTSCVEVEKDDLTTEGEKSYYASKENCDAGQKVAVVVGDYENFAAQCGAIAAHVPASNRLRSCDCDFSKTPFSARYPTLCAVAFQEGCMALEMPGDCCETSSCMSALEVFDTPAGKEHELARRATCDDDIPGNCYNMNGVASDMSMDGSTDCCSQTCSSCGSELASGAVFEICSSNDPSGMTATCGRLSRYSLEDFVCDFSKCPENSHWSKEGEAVYKYMGLVKPTIVTIPDDPTDVAKPSAPSSSDPGTTTTVEDSNAMTESGAASSVSVVLSVLAAGIVTALL